MRFDTASRYAVLIACLAGFVLAGCKPKGDAMSEFDDEPRHEEIPVDPVVTKDLFLEWRSPRFGNANPQRMNNPVWEWLIKTRLNAYQATARLDGPSAKDAGPGWCFDRFGQSSTTLPDGRIVLIAGEHEDHYDPDFYIYNDVVIQHPDGRLDIYGYPREVFPPTDFHTATIVGDRIVIIGSLGYPDDRRPGQTQVLMLKLDDLSVQEMPTSGAMLGWIHEHRATLADDGNSILIERGQLYRGGEGALVENIDDWRLYLSDWRWERLTERNWPRWEVRRSDRKRNHLFEYRQARWAKEFPQFAGSGDDFNALREELGTTPNLELFADLFHPPIPHEVLPKSEDEYGVHRVKIDDVVVRYVEQMYSVQLTIEGQLSEELQTRLASDLFEKLTRLENAPCELVKL